MAKLTPEQIAKANTEHAHQAAYFCWLRSVQDRYPQVQWIYAVPNGGDRDAITAGRLKAEGVRAGVWDICIPFPSGPYACAYIEMKKPGRQKEANGGLSPKQIEFMKFAYPYGIALTVCYSWEEARDATLEYIQT